MTHLQFEDRDCPVCRASPGESDLEVSAHVNPETTTVSVVREKWEGFHSRTCYFDYFRCRSCGTLFNTRFFSAETTDYLYSSIADNTSGAPIETHEKTQRTYAETLRNLGAAQGPCIEVGPDMGLATAALVRMGVATSAWFVEKNNESDPFLTKLRAEVQVEILRDTRYLPKTGLATTALLVHVLDHVLQPRTTLSDVRDAMADGGRVLVVVHNERSLLRRLLGRRWPPFRMQHPHLFSEKSLEVLLSQTGFSDIQIKRATNYMTIRHAFCLGASSIGIPSALGQLIPNRQVPLKLGNLIATAVKNS